MIPLLLVMLGGALGSGARYLTGRAALSLLGPNFPYGTLAVNLIGGLAMGLLVGALSRMNAPGDNLRLLLAVGVLGGFTTFSSFSLDAVTLFERGALGTAAFYILISVVGSIAAVFAGLALTRISA